MELKDEENQLQKEEKEETVINIDELNKKEKPINYETSETLGEGVDQDSRTQQMLNLKEHISARSPFSVTYLVEGFTPNAVYNYFVIISSGLATYAVTSTQIKLLSFSRFNKDLQSNLEYGEGLDPLKSIIFNHYTPVLTLCFCLTKRESKTYTLNLDALNGSITNESSPRKNSQANRKTMKKSQHLGKKFTLKKNSKTQLFDLNFENSCEYYSYEQVVKLIGTEFSKSSWRKVFHIDYKSNKLPKALALKQLEQIKYRPEFQHISFESITYYDYSEENTKYKVFKYDSKNPGVYLLVGTNQLQFSFELMKAENKKFLVRKIWTVFDLFGEKLKKLFAKNPHQRGFRYGSNLKFRVLGVCKRAKRLILVLNMRSKSHIISVGSLFLTLQAILSQEQSRLMKMTKRWLS